MQLWVQARNAHASLPHCEKALAARVRKALDEAGSGVYEVLMENVCFID